MQTPRSQREKSEYNRSSLSVLRAWRVQLFTCKPHYASSRLRNITPPRPAMSFARSESQTERGNVNPPSSQQTDSPENHRRAPRPRPATTILPAFPEKKGPKKPTAEPTSTPLHAPSSIRPTLVPAAILQGSSKHRHVRGAAGSEVGHCLGGWARCAVGYGVRRRRTDCAYSVVVQVLDTSLMRRGERLCFFLPRGEARRAML